ncbi:hypothetical protein SDJN02_07261, partial [Cucurbita argyrosperma subsp. argyrosperma]
MKWNLQPPLEYDRISIRATERHGKSSIMAIQGQLREHFLQALERMQSLRTSATLQTLAGNSKKTIT